MAGNTKFKEYELTFYESIEKFITGGKAIFTIRNEKTNNRFTYKFVQNQNDPNVFWVYMLCMSAGEDRDNYKFLGGFSAQKLFMHSSKSPIKNDTLGVKSIRWFCKHLYQRDFPAHFKIYHLSHCGRCGKPLTDPNSIISGFGPECMKKEVMEGNKKPIERLEGHDQRFNEYMVRQEKGKNYIAKYIQSSFNFFK